MKKLTLLLLTVFLLGNKTMSQCTVPTFLTMTYTFTEAYAGTTVDVTWNTDCPAALMRVSIIRYSPLPALVLEDHLNLPNTGSFMYPINAGYVAGSYGFYVQDMGANIWHYGPTFDLLGALLPVEFISFDGKVANEQVELNWSTASELNNEKFEIHRSVNTRDWKAIDAVAGQGTSNHINTYSFLDTTPFSGVNYYRLKQIDFDGNFEFSKVISVDFEPFDQEVQIYPNPATEHFYLMGTTEGRIQIFDQLGRMVKDLIVWESPIDISDFPKGIYLVHINNQHKVISKKLIVE